ncbi:MAG TPA: DUF1343 domain-containing protein [Candidatus Kapabacteria bacterium]|nr:DUF1343 domain-containing protein [Candidatus Kapabacteria bacterium]
MMKYIQFATFCLIAISAHAKVMTGLDNLVAEHFAPLKGRHVGLITNQTGRARGGAFGAELFSKSKALTLVALFAPEHGLFGTRAAGVPSDTLERLDGVPIYSLYGSTRKPTHAMLRGIDALVFDIQDAGVRPYTYLSTMIDAMESAAENKIPFYVLDRPNPLSGDRIEGNILDSSLESFVGIIPVPYLHGMTLGELAQMAKAKAWFRGAAKLKLTVIPMTGWKRSMYWNETGLEWIATSPNVPDFANDVGLAMLGATGELGLLSIGIGSDFPFLRIGSTLMGQDEIQRFVDSAFQPPPDPLLLKEGGLLFLPEDFTATTSGGMKTYHGVRIELPSALKSISSLYEPQFRIIEMMLHDPAFRASFDELPASTNARYEKVTGMHGLLDMLRRCEDLSPVFSNWRSDDERFRDDRAPFLLYP